MGWESVNQSIVGYRRLELTELAMGYTTRTIYAVVDASAQVALAIGTDVTEITVSVTSVALMTPVTAAASGFRLLSGIAKMVGALAAYEDGQALRHCSEIYIQSDCFEKSDYPGRRERAYAIVQHFREISGLNVHYVEDYDQCDNPIWVASKYGGKAILQVLIPEHANYTTTTYNYTHDDKSHTVYTSAEGVKRFHAWEYPMDSHYRCWYGTQEARITKIRLCPNHYLVLVQCSATKGIIASWRKPTTTVRLSRVQCVEGNFVRKTAITGTGIVVRTGLVNGFAQSETTLEIDTAIAALAMDTKHIIQLGCVVKMLKEDKPGAIMLHTYYLSKRVPQVYVPVEIPESVHRYQFGEYEKEAKPSVIPFMTPILNECYAPDKTLGNEKRAVLCRIEKVASSADMGSDVFQHAQDFVELFVGGFLEQEPAEYGELLDKQCTQAQRKIIQDSYMQDCVASTKVFQKSETYLACSDPRLISTLQGKWKVRYSLFMYRLSERVKECPWYAFGRKPRAAAERVSEVCGGANSVILTDFSRFDGRLSMLFRKLEMMILLRMFKSEHHAELRELHAGQYNQKAFATFGTQYHTGTARLSGSPETAVFNSLANAFVAYVVLRTQYPEYPAAICYGRLGVYGGDDGLTADVDQDIYTKIATRVGQVITAEVIERGHFGVTFLARIYGPYVWYGDPNSCSDLVRQLAKFHTTVALPGNVTPLMKLQEKAFAFSLMDANTPVFRQILPVALQGYDPAMFMNLTQKWGADVPMEDQYPNVEAAWMYGYFVEVLPEYNLGALIQWLTNKTPQELLRIPHFNGTEAPVVTPEDCIVTNDVEAIRDEPERTARRPRGRGKRHK